MSDINLSISTGTNVLTQAVGSDEVNLALSSTTNVHTTAIQTQNNISIDLDASVTPTSILNLTDVNASSITNGQLLQFDSTSGTFLNSDISLNELSDVAITSVSNNQVLAYNATSGNFVNVSLDSDSFNIDASQIAVNLGSGLEGRLVTVNSDGTLSAENLALYDTAGAQGLQLISTDQGEPSIILDNRNSSSTNPSFIQFRKDKGAAGADGDDIGKIDFVSDDAGQTITTFGQILAEVEEADDNDEAGKLSLKVSNDGTLRDGIVITGDKSTAGEVDVTVGNGSASLTTVAGDLSVTTGLTLGTALTVANGGTGATSLTDNAFLMGSGTAAIEASPHLKYSEPSGNVDTFTFGDDSTTTVSIVSDNRANLNLSVEAASGTTDTDGGDLTLTAGGSTGAGDPGDIIFLVSPTTSTGPGTTNQNTPVEVMRLEQGSLTLQSSINSSPSFILKSTDSSVNTGHSIQFIRDEGDAGASGDILGIIQFTGDDAGQTQTDYAKFLVTTDVATDGEESGKIELQVASHDAELVTGLSLTGGSAEDEIDVTIGSGSDSVTTISGDLDIDGDKITTAGNIEIETGGSGNITLDAAGDIALEAGGGDITANANSFTLSNDVGSSSNEPKLTIHSLDNTTSSGVLEFFSTRGTAGTTDAVDGDDLGRIDFKGQDDSTPTEHTYASILGEIVDATASNEMGQMRFKVSSGYSFTSLDVQALLLTGGSNGRADVTLGNSVSSMTTTTGDLTVSGGDINGPTDGNLNISSDDNILLTLDADSDSTSFVKVVSGASNVATISETGSIFTADTIELGHATDTTIARSAAGKVTIEGNEIQTTNVHHHFLNAGFFMSFPFSRYIPLNGSILEQNTSTASPEYTHFIFPYDGFVKTMWLRSETDMGSTELKLYGGTAGNQVTTAKGAVTATVSAEGTTEFDFTSVTNTFVQGESMAVRIDPTDDPDGGQNITIELVFNLTT